MMDLIRLGVFRLVLVFIVHVFQNIFSYGLLIQFTDLQGPVVQSIVSLTSSLVVKMLNVLISTISNSQVFLLKKIELQTTHIFSAKIFVYMPYLMIKVLMIH